MERNAYLVYRLGCSLNDSSSPCILRHLVPAGVADDQSKSKSLVKEVCSPENPDSMTFYIINEVNFDFIWDLRFC